MADSTRTDDRTTADDGARRHAANQRVDKLKGDLSKAVTGREELIKAKAAQFADLIDKRTNGRHRQKLRVAVHVVEFVVDRVGGPSSARAADASGTAPRQEEPEDLGEFRNVSDRR